MALFLLDEERFEMLLLRALHVLGVHCGGCTYALQHDRFKRVGGASDSLVDLLHLEQTRVAALDSE